MNKSQENLCCVCTSIIEACFYGHLECFNFYYMSNEDDINKLYKFPPHIEDDVKETLLHIACISGNTYLVKKLLSLKNIDPNTKNSNDVTPLELMCRGIESFDYVNYSKKYFKKICYNKIIYLLLSSDNVIISELPLKDFLTSNDLFEHYGCEYDTYSKYFNLRKKKCQEICEIIKLFLLKKAKFGWGKTYEYYYGECHILEFYKKNANSFKDIAQYAVQEWKGNILTIDIQRQNILYLMLEYDYISYEECKNAKLNKNSMKIVELWKNSALDIKIPSDE